MKFEWDNRKNQINRAKHGFNFADAYRIFGSPMVVELKALSYERKYYEEYITN
ncbi:MAG: hypothetical protein ACOYMQ_10895 [Pseudanabaena sp.]